MIENLNALSFGHYGRVLKEADLSALEMLTAARPTIDIASAATTEPASAEPTTPAADTDNDLYSGTLSFAESNNIIYKVTGGSLLLDIIEGQAVLIVSKSEEMLDSQMFLLDKRAEIYEGVCLCIYAMFGTCQISVCHGEGVRLSELSPIDDAALLYRENLRLLPAIELKGINTLFYQEKDPGFYFKGEMHSFWELTYVDKESMITNVDGVTYSLKKGDVIFYGPGQYHSQMAEHDVAVSFVTVTFDMDIQNPEIIQNKVFQISREQANLLDKVLYEREHSLFFSEDLIFCYLKELIITMIRADRLNISEVSLDSQLRLNIENHVADAAGEFILNNICSRIAVADIAAAVNVSSSYLSVMFKKRKGMTLIEFVNHHKLERSRQMIKDGKHNFTEISELLGFNSVHYFSRQFKNKYGLTPTDYERALR
jgi:AraC-like DNA-binding protein